MKRWLLCRRLFLRILGGYLLVSLAYAQTLTVLHSFTGGADGGRPYLGSLFMDVAGNLYGTTEAGGDLSCDPPIGCGVVFKLDPSGNETVLHTFGGLADGAHPFAGVIRDSLGNLYGTTIQGGSRFDAGVVYKVDGNSNETILYVFSGGNDGGNPYAGLVRDSSGNLYGAALNGGLFSGGVVFKLPILKPGREVVLHSFGATGDGLYPFATLLRKSGVLYGTTNQGGSTNCEFGCGIIFKLKGKTETVLYRFAGSMDGEYPIGALIGDSSGDLYGTTSRGGGTGCGGNIGCGTAFVLNSGGSEILLHSFSGSDGFYPDSNVIRDIAGNLYGTTFWGGIFTGCVNSSGCGTIYKVDSQGNQSVLYNFTGGLDGANPYAGVIRDSAGNLYGTTAYGGSDNEGVVFKLSF